MHVLGIISDIRDDSLRPVKVDLIGLGDGAMELDWMLVSLSAWAGISLEQLKVGMECCVWDTGFVGHPDKYRVQHFYPNADAGLPDNRKPVARQGDPVAISGYPKLTAVAIAATAALPEVVLSHDLTGRILTNG